MVAIAALPATAQKEYIKYQCEQGKTLEVQIQDDKAKVRLDSGQTIRLLPLDTREGLKFSDGRAVLTVKENQAFLEINYTPVFTKCVSQY
jgi:membrane-bound inhibitor of C-type lysozyme